MPKLIWACKQPLSAKLLKWAWSTGTPTPSSKLVLLRLAYYGQEYVKLKVEELMADCGLSRRAVFDALKALERQGLISRVRVSGEGVFVHFRLEAEYHFETDESQNDTLESQIDTREYQNDTGEYQIDTHESQNDTLEYQIDTRECRIRTDECEICTAECRIRTQECRFCTEGCKICTEECKICTDECKIDTAPNPPPSITPPYNNTSYLTESKIAWYDRADERAKARDAQGVASSRPSSSLDEDKPLIGKASQIYRHFFQRYPTPHKRLAIEKTVRNLSIWREVLQEWKENDWSPSNVEGMLDRYQRRLNENTPDPSASDAKATSLVEWTEYWTAFRIWEKRNRPGGKFPPPWWKQRINPESGLLELVVPPRSVDQNRAPGSQSKEEPPEEEPEQTQEPLRRVSAKTSGPKPLGSLLKSIPNLQTTP